MCEVWDDERAEVWKNSHRRARKEHNCEACGGKIRTGERYLINFTVYEGVAGSSKACSKCENAINAFATAHEGYHPHPTSLDVVLEECVEENDGDAKMRKKWQRYLREMRARRAARAA